MSCQLTPPRLPGVSIYDAGYMLDYSCFCGSRILPCSSADLANCKFIATAFTCYDLVLIQQASYSPLQGVLGLFCWFFFLWPTENYAARVGSKNMNHAH